MSLVDALVVVLCGDYGAAEWTAPPGAKGYRCSETSHQGFIKVFPDNASQVAWMTSLNDCVGGMVAGDGWVVHQYGGNLATKTLLIRMGGTVIC